MNMNFFHQSYIYELNTRVFCIEERCTLKNFPKKFFESPEYLAADAIWLMGIWEKSPNSIQIVRRDEGDNHNFLRILQDLKKEDMIGSPYAIYNYEPNPLVAESWEEISDFRDRLHRDKKRLILDFVPNHMAMDTPLLDQHPDLFLSKEMNIICKNSFLHKNKIYFYGRDPHFDGWSDTVQWDFSKQGTFALHLDILTKISLVCDGVRCDMAMLMDPQVFYKTHGKYALPYWKPLISEIKSMHPEFQFIAEVYWDMEYYMQTLGFDFTYDKKLYDKMKDISSSAVREHLLSNLEFQEHSMRFIENHDEERAYHFFGQKSIHYFSLLCFLPGMILYHDGQPLGKEVRIPVQLARKPNEKPRIEIEKFYQRAFGQIKQRKSNEYTFIKWKLEPYNDYELKDVVLYILVNKNITSNSVNDIEILIYNPYPFTIAGKLEFPEVVKYQLFISKLPKLVFNDLSNGIHYSKEIKEIIYNGMYIQLNAGQSHWLVTAK